MISRLLGFRIARTVIWYVGFSYSYGLRSRKKTAQTLVAHREWRGSLRGPHRVSSHIGLHYVGKYSFAARVLIGNVYGPRIVGNATTRCENPACNELIPRCYPYPPAPF